MLDDSDVGVIVLYSMTGIQGLTASATSSQAPKDARKAYEKGLAAVKKDKPDQAEQEFRKAVQIYPKYAEAWLELGEVLDRGERYPEAREAYASSLAADPKYVYPYQQLYQIALHEQNWKELADKTDQLLHLDPYEFPNAYYFNALAHLELKEYDAAEKSAQQAVEADWKKANPKTHYLLGAILVKKKDWAGAAESFRAYLKAAPDATDKEYVEKTLGQIDQQIKVVQTALRIPPRNHSWIKQPLDNLFWQRAIIRFPPKKTRNPFMDEKERARALGATLGQIEKQFGKGSVIRLGAQAVQAVPTISTGSISIDAALGIGGFPRGRISEIFGPESSGKTTVALQVVAEAQKVGGMAAYIDVEHALDPVYARKLGVDVDNLLVSQPDYGEQALEITNALIASGSIDVLVVDSVAALVPKAELDGEMGDSFMGVHARLMSQAMRKLTGIVSKSNTCLIFINQIREKIGVMFGNPETTTGGRALKFYSSVRADIRRIAAIKDGETVTGNRTKIKIVKNKMAPPFREAEFDIIYGEGISKEGDLVDLGVQHNLIEKSGAWYSYKGERIGQGRENAKQFLRENSDVYKKVDAELRKQLGLVRADSPVA